MRCIMKLDWIDITLILAAIVLWFLQLNMEIDQIKQQIKPDKTISELKRLNKNFEIYLIQSGMWPAGEPLPEWRKQ
jgi:hypothetical protein